MYSLNRDDDGRHHPPSSPLAPWLMLWLFLPLAATSTSTEEAATATTHKARPSPMAEAAGPPPAGGDVNLDRGSRVGHHPRPGRPPPLNHLGPLEQAHAPCCSGAAPFPGPAISPLLLHGALLALSFLAGALNRGNCPSFLLEDNIHPRENLPPLLVNLRDRRPEKLHYLGVSFGLTQELFRFWRKHGFFPFNVARFQVLLLKSIPVWPRVP